ncbi:hypothetical protein [Mycolicibacterium sp. lyk4-40-TYG-92]|uniref:hypothetical protein n=1 Tax=Mycolicibacterium sp. lyk4-40-TYG-92 TaxID=3040295 RepID=UPI002550CAE1|nr:hypothetical protein [Mycolicibacterium sp. lyk4-40-TYG-92]
MTAVTEPEAFVETASLDDTRQAIRNALRRAGAASFDDLAKQAKDGHYTSTRARLAWMAIGDLYGLIDAG